MNATFALPTKDPDLVGNMPIGRFSSSEDVLNFVFAGNATFTIVSKKTGTRFTYKVTRAEDKDGKMLDNYFVNLLSGPDNESSFTYMGLIKSEYDTPLAFTRTKSSKVAMTAPSWLAFAFFFGRLVLAGKPIPSTMEVWHTGRCGRCGRKLTVPASVAAGIGPECSSMMG